MLLYKKIRFNASTTCRVAKYLRQLNLFTFERKRFLSNRILDFKNFTVEFREDIPTE